MSKKKQTCKHVPLDLFDGQPPFSLTYQSKDGKVSIHKFALCKKCRCLYLPKPEEEGGK